MNSGIAMEEWAAFSSYSAIALFPKSKAIALSHPTSIALHYSRQSKAIAFWLKLIEAPVVSAKRF